MEFFIIKKQKGDFSTEYMDFVDRNDRLRVRYMGKISLRAHLIKKLPKVYFKFLLKKNQIANFFDLNQKNIAICLKNLILLNKFNMFFHHKLFFLNQRFKIIFFKSKIFNQFKKKKREIKNLEHKKAHYFVLKLSNYFKIKLKNEQKAIIK